MFLKAENGTDFPVARVIRLYVAGTGTDWLVRMDLSDGLGTVDIKTGLTSQAAAEAVLNRVVKALGTIEQ